LQSYETLVKPAAGGRRRRQENQSESGKMCGRKGGGRQEAAAGGRRCTDSLSHKLAQKSTGLLPSLWRGQGGGKSE